MRAFNRFFLLIVVLIISPLLFAKIEISESVKDFRYPRFSKSGFIEWVLRGQSGVYEDALISVELFNLRLYSADASTEVMCEVFSDSALLDTESGLSYSDESILIKGDGFEIKGADWLWDLLATFRERLPGGNKYSHTPLMEPIEFISMDSQTQLKVELLLFICIVTQY